MGDDVISRVEASISRLGQRQRYITVSLDDLRELLALARSNRDALDENDLIGAVLAHTRAVGGAIKCDISNAKFAIRQVLDRLPSPPDTGE